MKEGGKFEEGVEVHHVRLQRMVHLCDQAGCEADAFMNERTELLQMWSKIKP